MLLKSPIKRLPLRNRKQWATNLLLSALATEFLGASITVPIMAQYAASFNVDKGLVGLVFSVGAFATLLSDFWLPRVSDAYGRKPAILLSLIGSTVAYTMEAVAPTFGFLLFAAFVGGMFGGTPPVAVAYVSDIFPPKERPQYIGLVPAIISSCFVLGPTIGGFIANATNSFRFPITVSAIFCGALALPLVVFFLPDSKHLISAEEKLELVELDEEDDTIGRGSTKTSDVVDETSELIDSKIINYPGPWKDWRCWVCFFISLFNNTAFSCFVTTIPLVLGEPVFGLTSEHESVYYTGLVLGSGAIVQAFSMVFLFNAVQSRIGLVSCVYLGTTISFLGYVFISFQTSVLGMAIGFGLFTLGNSFTRPGYTTHITNIIPTEFTARAIAMPSIASSVAGLLSPIGSTELLARTDSASLYRLASGVLLVQLVIAVSFLRSEEKKGDEEGDEGEDSEKGVFGAKSLLHELAKILKHRNYNIEDPTTQKIILEMAHRSFPYLDSGDKNKEDINNLMKELNVSECEEEKCKLKRYSIAKRTSATFAAAQMTQLME